MTTAQPGIFALGTASHAYLELDAVATVRARELVTVIASLREQHALRHDHRPRHDVRRVLRPAEPSVAMLDSMVGRTTGIRDALTRFTFPLSGAYHFVPSADALRRAGASPTA